MKPSIDYLKTRICVDVDVGKVYWIDATKYHASLNGTEAGTKRRCSSGDKYYWHIKIDSLPIKRSHIVFLFSTGAWPAAQIDHINGNSLDDRRENLREATQTQNAWNHKGRTKAGDIPMGIRRLKSGRFQARIACNKKTHTIGTFDTAESALSAYREKRNELFGEFA